MSTSPPPPVYARDTRLTDLGTAEGFVVTVLRLWVAGRSEPGNPALDWRRAFAAAGVEQQAMPSFGCFMDIVASTAVRTIWLRPLHCLMLGGDEARLLQLVSLLQRDCTGPAAAIMSEFLPPAAVQLAERVGQALAAALKAARLIVPLRHAEAARPQQLSLAAHATPGLVLVQ